MKAERLLALADYLENVPRKKFYMGTYYSIPDGTKRKDFEKVRRKKSGHVVVLKEGFCGTTACVLGHAAMMPEFIDKGLYIDISETGWDGDLQPVVRYKDWVAGDAGQHFFGLSEHDAAELFTFAETEAYGGVDVKLTPKKAAKYIRKFVKENSV